MIKLRINKIDYTGWEKISIIKDMTSISHTFNLSIERGSTVNVSSGDFIEIIDDNKIFLSGYIDILDITISSEKSPMILSGRSKSLDLVDCMIENFKQYNQLTPLAIIKDITADFDIEILSDISLPVVNTFETKVGETFFNAINRLCKQTNILPISNNRGNIILTKNQNGVISRILKDKDLKKIQFVSDLSSQYSKYTYKKEAIITDVTDGSVDNEIISRYRPFVAANTENKTNADMANWKKNNSEINGTQLNITVDNWDLEINTIIGIESQVIKGSYLIKNITYIKGENGKFSNIILVDRNSFNA